MIIVDLQQVMISNLMVSMGNHLGGSKIEEGLLRHMILNSIRSYSQKYKGSYGEMTIACDDRESWRREIYPYYKANRRSGREESDIDWSSIFEYFAKIKNELRENMPYRVVQVPKAEADDVIATLVHEYGPEGQRILILSGDKDFIQLHQYLGVEQYDPVRKKKITHPNPSRFKMEHIIKGDKGDGVPNILMADNSLVLRERSRPITKKKLDTWPDLRPEDYCNDLMLQRWYRNQQMIDLDKIPESVKEQVLATYESEAGKTRSKMFNYFMKFKLKHLMESIGDF